MGSLNGKKALVTAGAQGIGQAITEELIARGCHVAIHYFSSEETANELVKRGHNAGVQAQAFQADLTVEEEAIKMVDSAIQFLGGLDILVNNAGTLVGRKTLEETTVEFWQKVMDVNMTSMMLVTRQALPYLEKAGGASVVNLSSIAGRAGGSKGSQPYSAAKAAVIGWTRATASELGPKGIRVNAVAPGLVLGSQFHAEHSSKEKIERTIAGIPVGRAGTTHDIAKVVAFFAQEYDGFTSGATLDVNGGSYCA